MHRPAWYPRATSARRALGLAPLMLALTAGAALALPQLSNSVGGAHSFIGGGDQNSTAADYSAIAGGRDNHVTDYGGFIGGGTGNQAGDGTASKTNAEMATV